MSKFLRGNCQACGGPIEFPVESTGETVECPHCNQPTELLLETPAAASSGIPTKTIVYTIVAIVILVGGLVGAMIAVKRAKGIAERRNAATKAATPTKPTNPFADVAFKAGPVTLDKVSGSSLVYAVGSIHSLTNRQRFGVRVELDIFDASGQRLNGETNRPSDYQQVIEANGEWKFRVSVLDKKAASAKIAAIKEQN